MRMLCITIVYRSITFSQVKENERVKEVVTVREVEERVRVVTRDQVLTTLQRGLVGWPEQIKWACV